MKPATLPACLLLILTGCNDNGDQVQPSQNTHLTTIADGLNHPWSLAFLPDGSMLVTERKGAMRRISADGKSKSAPLTGLPTVVAEGQGGLLDVALDPDFSENSRIYWSYSEAGTGAEASLSGTAVARGTLDGKQVKDVQVIFRQQPKAGTSGHYGSRLVFARDKTLFVTLGERLLDQPASPGKNFAQNLNTHLGKVIHITRDGLPASNNPKFPGTALPEIWSYGHRNPQGAALHPQTGDLWICEHGPQGGDEINLIEADKNYGWPLRSYGCPYGSNTQSVCQVNGGVHQPDYQEPLAYWTPTSIAPSGMAFYQGNRYPEWRGKLFIGALAGEAVWQLSLDGNQISDRKQIDLGERIRDIRQGPDEAMYLLTDSDNGKILRLVP